MTYRQSMLVQRNSCEFEARVLEDRSAGTWTHDAVRPATVTLCSEVTGPASPSGATPLPTPDLTVPSPPAAPAALLAPLPSTR